MSVDQRDLLMETALKKVEVFWVPTEFYVWRAEFERNWEDKRLLAEKKSAYERVLEQAAAFMKREAALWVLNNQLLARAKKAESELLEFKNLTKYAWRDDWLKGKQND